jgi:predicted metal-dependent phosphoesterase TrpH
VFYDGVSSPRDIVEAAKRRGLDAIAVSDHNTMNGYKEAKKFSKKYGITVFPAEEISTPQGHLLAFGISENIRPGISVLETIDMIHDRGGIAIAVHPFDVKREGLGSLAKKCDAVEIFNSINVDRISNMHAKRFVRKHEMPFTVGSDAHSAEMIGCSINEMCASSLDDVIKSIMKKRNIIHPRYHSTTMMMNWAVQRIKLSNEYIEKYIDENYRWHRRVISKHMLNLTKHSPGRVDNLFKTFAYVSLGSVFTYRVMSEIASFLNPQ